MERQCCPYHQQQFFFRVFAQLKSKKKISIFMEQFYLFSNLNINYLLVTEKFLYREIFGLIKLSILFEIISDELLK